MSLHAHTHSGHAVRRTFAIISHPDAGKTTLTEKLLLAGGAMRLAVEVKASGERRRRGPSSDWMKIEQTRGISVTTSVMTFEYGPITFNLLDTPGHQDFSEDTYRTLTAVDSAVMVIDAARGIQSQTRKLFEVCRMRDVPIVTFINKIDREARDPFELLDEIADTLALDVTPVVWPIGMGMDFRGCCDVRQNRAKLVDVAARDESDEWLALDDPALAAGLLPGQLDQLRENIELVRAVCPPLDVDAYRAGHLTPVFFGSALRDFGVRALLDGLVEMAPSPHAQPAVPRAIEPDEPSVTGFVFKVQANMDPNHRDRVAFVRLCSGKLQRGSKLHLVRTGKPISVRNPIFFFAQGRELAEEAYPGDIVGIPNHGTLRVGDTLSEGEALQVSGIPSFAPEILRRVAVSDAMKTKHLARALESLAEEGVTQVFRPVLGSDWIVGVVGALQLDVLASRLEHEYGLGVRFEPVAYETARWLGPPDSPDLAAFVDANRSSVATDGNGAYVFLARNSWALNDAQSDWKSLRFSDTREIMARPGEGEE